MTREGNLEAPTRHPLDWQNPAFYDEAACFTELERIFDICHGCRRCVSLCGSFPTLFDLVDNSPTLELDGVAKADYWKVVDQCYLCDLCYMTKCPYVPPHAWNLDFPHTMLRAKAIKFRQGKVGQGRAVSGLHRRARQLCRHPRRGAGGQRRQPHQGGARRDGKPAGRGQRRVASVAGHAQIPVCRARCRRQRPVNDGARPPARWPSYSTCYINYNEPGIGLDLLKILDHNARSPTCWSRKSAAAACPSWSWATWTRCAPPRKPTSPCWRNTPKTALPSWRRAQLRADVQAGTAAHVPRLRRHAAGQGACLGPV
jgi:glycerol-3-phosphate dehydrogenase subunit C